MGHTLKLKIGEFARLGQVTVQTLRYYAELDLLRPGEVDPFTGYRYYLLDQLPALHRILVLKDMGIPLDQVNRMLHENISTEEMRRILLIKQDNIRTQVQNSLDQLERIDIRLKMLDHKIPSSSYEINVKHVDALPVASVTGIVPNYWDVTPLWMDLYSRMKQENLQPASPYLTLCHTAEQRFNLRYVLLWAIQVGIRLAGLVHILPEVKPGIHQTSWFVLGLIDGIHRIVPMGK